MGRILILSFLLLLTACERGSQGHAGPDAVETEEPLGSYVVDPETGEITAMHRGEDGSLTTLRSGEKVAAQLPHGFTLYPGARTAGTTLVRSPGGDMLVIDMTTEDSAEKMVDHYRAEAESAGMTISVDIRATPGRTIAAEGDGESRLTFTTSRKSALTQAQLSIWTASE